MGNKDYQKRREHEILFDYKIRPEIDEEFHAYMKDRFAKGLDCTCKNKNGKITATMSDETIIEKEVEN